MTSTRRDFVRQSAAAAAGAVAGIPIDIVSILQAVILMFIAAPAIIRTIYRLRKPVHDEGVTVATSWGAD